jgi:hypothetical protein
VGKDAAETVNMESGSTNESKTEPQRWEQPPPREETDLIIESMQATEPEVEDQDMVDHSVNSREQTVDDVTDIDGRR